VKRTELKRSQFCVRCQ